MSAPPHGHGKGWLIWFDGSALPNPGRMGLGVVLRSPEGVESRYSGLGPGNGCNNQAELLALCKALEMAQEAGADDLLIRGDSDFAVRHSRGEAHTDVVPLCALVERSRALLGRFSAAQVLWIPRHRNPAADQLSRAALGLPDKPAPWPVSRRRR